jgi:hypothetical protein
LHHHRSYWSVGGWWKGERWSLCPRRGRESRKGRERPRIKGESGKGTCGEGGGDHMTKSEEGKEQNPCSSSIAASDTSNNPSREPNKPELNRIIEIARGQLPGNGCLRKRLVANMNIHESCNVFW